MSGMFMFPGMFYNHIKDSKLKMPEDFENYDPEEYPHFHVFILTHLGQPIDITALEDNANIIADIPENAIKSVTLNDLMEKGVVFGTGDLVWNGNLLGLESEVNFMDYKLLAKKYIKYGIKWLEGEFDTYKGMTTIMETEENLNGEQLRMLCDEIKKDTRVKMAMIESEHEYTITIMFNR